MCPADAVAVKNRHTRELNKTMDKLQNPTYRGCIAKRPPGFCERKNWTTAVGCQGCIAEPCSDTGGALPSRTNQGCIAEGAKEIDSFMPYTGGTAHFGYRGCVAEP